MLDLIVLDCTLVTMKIKDELNKIQSVWELFWNMVVILFVF